MSITTQTEGRRTYIVGNTYPHRNAIKALGAHWDSERRAWWTSKREPAEELAAKLSSIGERKPTPDAPGENATLAGKAQYKGRTYYLAGRIIRGRTRYDDGVQGIVSRDGAKVLLYSRDGSMQFWASLTGAPDAAVITRSYERPQTIAGLDGYAKRLRESGDSPELDAARRRGWDGKIGSLSYYSSGAFDEIDA